MIEWLLENFYDSVHDLCWCFLRALIVSVFCYLLFVFVVNVKSLSNVQRTSVKQCQTWLVCNCYEQKCSCSKWMWNCNFVPRHSRWIYYSPSCCRVCLFILTFLFLFVISAHLLFAILFILWSDLIHAHNCIWTAAYWNRCRSRVVCYLQVCAVGLFGLVLL